MSQIKVDQITDEAGTGAPDFPNGLTGVVPAASILGALNATGDAPVYACRAWVNFNGTGTVAIRASGNVSSITDNGAGDYTVNFTTAIPDANYAAACLGSTPFGGAATNGMSAVEFLTAGPAISRTTSAFRFLTLSSGFVATDAFSVNVAIFR